MTDFYGIDPAEIAAVQERIPSGDPEGAARKISDATLDTFIAAGTPSEIPAGVIPLVDAGASTITFSAGSAPTRSRPSTPSARWCSPRCSPTRAAR